MKDDLVSIIIINYNGRSYLEECLASLMKVTYSNFEIIVVDNCSTDDSLEFVKNNHPTVIIIKLEKNYGFSHPNNVGAKNAKGELLLFLNNDTKVNPEFLSAMVNELKKDPKIAMCQSLLLNFNGEVDSSGDFIDSIGACFSSKKKIEKIRNILSAKGAAMMMRKEIFEKLGGFDEKFFASFEDVDLGWRTWILGYKVVVIPQSVVYHVGGTTVKKLKDELTFHGYKNQLAMKITNFESDLALKNILKFIFSYGFRGLKVFFDYKLKGYTEIKTTNYEEKIAQKPNYWLLFKAVFWLFKNYNYLKKKHQKVNSSRIFSTDDLQKQKVIISDF